MRSAWHADTVRPLFADRTHVRYAHRVSRAERITELSGEGHRWEDLARWGDLGPGLASRDPGFANFKTGRDEFMPIPQADLDLNPNLKQNPGF